MSSSASPEPALLTRATRSATSSRVFSSLDLLLRNSARPDASRDPGATPAALSIPSPLWGGAQGWGADPHVDRQLAQPNHPPTLPLPTRERGAEPPRLGIAISGGSDSTALLLLAQDWASSRGAALHAATVDHGLRPEAAREAEQVAALCASLGIPHTTLRWNPVGHVSQAGAREARHRLLAGWCTQAGVSHLALGHTADDRIETFLIRARAGSSWYGLAAPLPSAPSPAWPEGAGLRLVRPLLGCSRQALRQHLLAVDQPWIDDPTNEAGRHERSRARRLAARLSRDSRNRILAMTARLARLRAAVMAEARAALAEVSFNENEAFLPLAVLGALGEEPRLRLLQALILAAGNARVPPPDVPEPPVNLAGAWLRSLRHRLVVSPEPPRRTSATPLPPDWNRAANLLADPCAEVLSP